MTLKETVDAVANTPLEDIFQIILIGCVVFLAIQLAACVIAWVIHKWMVK
jgi:hypothetical protein